jgi:ribosomal protein S18 acetylase RimI-like enzyme
MVSNFLSIREVTLSEAPAVASLVRSAFASIASRFALTADNCPSHPSLCQQSWIERDLRRGAQFYLCLEHDEPVGCYGLVQSRDDAVRMEKLAVLPQNQCAGIGTALLEDAKVRAQNGGSTMMEVSVLHDNAELVAWYTRRGFTLSGTARYPHLPFMVGFLFADL